MLFKTFSSLLCPPPPTPSSTLKADDFATFFINKITNLTAQLSTPQTVKHILPANIHSFTSFSPLSEAEVSKLILSSHPTTCLLDPIPSHLLQAISPAVVPALTPIVNTSFHTGVFPSAFKQARITPLLKKPTLNPTLLGNYRPVSLLPFIAKTLERVVFNQVSAFLTQNNLLDSNQSGYRSGHSPETALLSVVEALKLAGAASKSSLLILLDLSAAFDTVNHQILLSTLLRKGISGTALQWVESYLSDRSFKVSKCVDAALAPLRLQGIRILNYIDDWLVLAQSERVAAQHRDVVLAHLKVLVLRLNAKKSVLSNSSGSTGTGCHGTDVADASSVRGSPIALLPGVLARVRRDEVSLLLVAPLWPGRVRFSDLISLLDGSPWEIPVRRDLLSQAVVFTPARRCGRFGCGPWGGATRSFRSLNRGCWDHTPIQSSLSEETVRLEVGTFTSWCGGRQLDLVNCPIGTVLELLQARFSAGLTHSTLKVHVAAIWPTTPLLVGNQWVDTP